MLPLLSSYGLSRNRTRTSPETTMIATAAAIAACVTGASSLSAKRATEAITTTAPMIRINQTTGGTNPSASPIRPCRPCRRSSFNETQCSKAAACLVSSTGTCSAGLLRRRDPRVHYRAPSAFPHRGPAVRDDLARIADHLPLQLRAGRRAEGAGGVEHRERGGRLILGVGLGAAVALECDEEDECEDHHVGGARHRVHGTRRNRIVEERSRRRVPADDEYAGRAQRGGTQDDQRGKPGFHDGLRSEGVHPIFERLVRTGQDLDPVCRKVANSA